MDLERTIGNGVPAFWKGNRYGYTYKIEFAGIFSKENAELIVKNDLDHKTVMVPVQLVTQILLQANQVNEGS